MRSLCRVVRALFRAVRSLFRAVVMRLFGSYCQKHRVSYYSDFCPQCVRAMAIRYETREIVSCEIAGQAGRRASE